MEEYFYSDKNINKIAATVEKYIPVKQNEKSRESFRKFIMVNMKSIYQFYAPKKPKNVPTRDFIDRLNKEIIKHCVKIYENKMNNSNKVPSAINRDKEINGTKNIGIMKRPIETAKKTKKNDGFEGFESSYIGSSSFASFEQLGSSDGGYITASGELGNKMHLNSSEMTLKKGSTDEIERAVLERAGEYDMPNMSYNGNGARRPPAEINFALDGGDTRGSAQNSNMNTNMQNNYETSNSNNNNNNNDFMGNSEFYGGFGNFSNFDGDNMQPPMQPPMQQPMQQNMQQKMISMDVKQNYEMLMNDRKNIEVPKGKFDPTKSPNVLNITNNNSNTSYNNNNNNNNNLNFHQGGRVGTMKKEDIKEKINAIREEIAKTYNLNLDKIMKMSAKSLSELINKIKNNDTSVAKYMITQPVIKQPAIKKMPANVKIKKVSFNNNADSDDEYEQLYADKDTKTDTKPDTKTNNNTKYSKKIVIQSDKYAQPEYFNDYMVELDKKYKNVSYISIEDIQIPTIKNAINGDDNNTFKFVLNTEDTIISEPLSFEISEGKYTIDEIVNAIQVGFNEMDVKMKIEIMKNNKIKIENINNKSFELIPGGLLKIMGFNADIYKNSTKYISDSAIKTKLYLYIDTISQTEPFGVIDITKPQKIHKTINPPIKELSELIIKFKNKITEDDDLHEFYKEPHKMTFVLSNNNNTNKISNY